MLKNFLNTKKNKEVTAEPPVSIAKQSFHERESTQADERLKETSTATTKHMEEYETMQNTNNMLSNDVEIKGTIKFESELTVDGKIEGEISSEGDLTIGENAQVDGEIKTRSVVVYGKVNGNITVSERCELKSKAQLIGDLKAARLVIEEGATFVGKSEVTPNKVNMPKPEAFSASKQKEEDKIAEFGT